MSGTYVIVDKALSLIQSYLTNEYSDTDRKTIWNEISKLSNRAAMFNYVDDRCYSYCELQDCLSILNEKETIRKVRGVYYTPDDIVKFILLNSIALLYNKNNHNFSGIESLSNEDARDFCLNRTVYDPTCGAGVFLLNALEVKLELLMKKSDSIDSWSIKKIVQTIKGNDSNEDSIFLTKLRILLCVLKQCGIDAIMGISDALNGSFYNYDYVEETSNNREKFDIIVGNPPYVEDSKSESEAPIKYGNIYANVLDNASKQLKNDGVLGFIVPLSYVSTPRMKKIRNELNEILSEQYIFSYADRPDCLFVGVHQKLNVIFGIKSKRKKKIYTSNYKYWYKAERATLFKDIAIVQNEFSTEQYIPKIGLPIEISIYNKIRNAGTPLYQVFDEGSESLYVNMRATFWIKAFRKEHAGSEYKKFSFKNSDDADYCMCLLNSSLFWWYWNCISDCWHITRKELVGFNVPNILDYSVISEMAELLEFKLEETKKYIGTRQTEYEYKHKDCIEEIHIIDDYVNKLYGLTKEECEYIKNYSFNYRIGGGAKYERD